MTQIIEVIGIIITSILTIIFGVKYAKKIKISCFTYDATFKNDEENGLNIDINQNIQRNATPMVIIPDSQKPAVLQKANSLPKNFSFIDTLHQERRIKKAIEISNVLKDLSPKTLNEVRKQLN